MRIAFQAAAAGVMVAFAAGCAGDSAGPPPPEEPAPPRARDGVSLQLDRRTAEPGDSLKLTVVNRGPVSLEFGLAYRLERWQGGWRWLNRDQAFVLIAVVVRPRESYDQVVALPEDLGVGRYRVVKSFTARAADRELEASVQFDVR